jgi:hydroxybutyrate-dimer hydrolase
VAEPNANVSGRTAGLAIESGGHAYERIGLSLFDYATEHLLLQPCALLAEAEQSLPVQNAIGASRGALEQWCRELGEIGVLPRADIATQAQEARRALLQAGILPEALQIGHMNVLASLWSAIAVSYAAAYGKLAADELPCGVSFAAIAADGSPRPLSEEELARAFSDSSGIAPTAGLNLVGPDSAGRLRALGQGSAALALRLRSLQTGSSLTQRIAAGEREALMTGRLPGCPVIIVQGRADALIPVNHSARAYYLVTQRHEDTRSQLRYYEIEHAQHFDAFLAIPELAARYVPMQPHLLEAMDLLSAHLRTGTALPPSQVVRSHPRASAGAKVAPLSRNNLGALRDRPAADAITFDGSTLHVPQ